MNEPMAGIRTRRRITLHWIGLARIQIKYQKQKVMENKEDKRTEELRNQYGENVELRTAEVRAAGDDSLVVEGYASNLT